jgi:acyl carrier protein
MDQNTVPLIRKFIAENFLYREGIESLADDASFLDAGLIDSTGILELVCFLEKTFAIRVADAEVIPDNLDSINRIAEYVTGKLAARPAATNGGVAAAAAVAAAAMAAVHAL